MPTAAYIFPTLDDEPIVPSLSDFSTTQKHTTTKTTTTIEEQQQEAKSTSIMDHQNTSTTLRTSAKRPTAEDELEELALGNLNTNDKSRDTDYFIEKEGGGGEEEAQTLNKRDYGNFALLVTLCKLST